MSGSEKQPPLGVYKCKELIHDIFLQSGQKDLMMAHIRHKSNQQGWTWTMRDEFIDYIKKRGTDNVNVSHMVIDLAPLGRELFPSELRKDLVNTIYEATKNYFTIDDSVTPITDPDNAHSEPERTFLFQSTDIKPEPGLGIDVEPDESPPPSPQSSTSASSTPHQSPGPVAVTTPPVPRQSPVQNNPRQSPGSAPRQSPVNSQRADATPPPLPPPPVLRAETAKSEPAPAAEEDEEQEEEEEDEDGRNNEENEEEDEDELMDV